MTPIVIQDLTPIVTNCHELLTQEIKNEEMEKMAQFVFQIYKTIFDFQRNLYPSVKNKNKKIYPLVLTLEEWFLFGENDLDERIEKKLKDSGVPTSFLEEMPYSICSIHEFEMMVQIIKKVGIINFMKEKVVGDNKSISFASFMRNNFNDELKSVKFLFDDVHTELFSLKGVQ